jgi:hypothetical protein
MAQIAHSSCYLDPICRLVPLRLRILSIKLLTLLAIVFYPLHVNCVVLSRVSFSMLPN